MDSVTATPGPRALLPRPAAAQGRDDPDPHRRRPGPDALHRPRRSSATTPGAGSRGRLVYELVAPGGDVYVMQAYAQILDPNLTIGKLRTLGRRLDLPAGWRYRARRLAHGARRRRERHGHDRPGRAAEHLPAGQAHARAPAGASATRSASTARRRWSTATTPGTIEDHGTVTGTPFGRGHGRARRHARRRAGHRHLPHAVRARARSPARSTCRSRSRAARSTSAAPRASPPARAPTAASRAARSRSHDHNTLDGQNGVSALDGGSRRY